MVPESGSHAKAAELRESRSGSSQAVDADRLERELHDGLQQRLIALAVELQLAESQAAPPAPAVSLRRRRRDFGGALESPVRPARSSARTASCSSTP